MCPRIKRQLCRAKGADLAAGKDVPTRSVGVRIGIEPIDQPIGLLLEDDCTPAVTGAAAQCRRTDPCFQGHAGGEVEPSRIGYRHPVIHTIESECPSITPRAAPCCTSNGPVMAASRGIRD